MGWGTGKERINELGEHSIITETTHPIVSPMYRIGPEMEMEAAKIIHKYIREGIIRESKSPWRSPIVMEPKKNGEYRLCIDYRRLNAVTVKDAYPMPPGR
ncbi:Transposon Ty3-I Gag-Pol polyprotein [Nosema granulosis]|uniref:Transposon Ty3-I Gag-Pol polyprotein n=1 Tax=Nosema granulosis TaxID=83296 RepID=A0A9P6GZQ3_9MICR|nr:Transposon Ty3-I Gag-Pol polyprotein [Nosema granulosis]